MRAVGQDMNIAEVSGINVDRTKNNCNNDVHNISCLRSNNIPSEYWNYEYLW